MANFPVTIDDTQKVLAHVALTSSGGASIPVTGLSVTPIDGAASFSMVDTAGNPLPVEQVYFVSGSSDGDSNFALSVAYGDGSTTVLASVTVTVLAGAISLSITFDAPEPK